MTITQTVEIPESRRLTIEVPHRDPFDRLLISKAIAEEMTLLTTCML